MLLQFAVENFRSIADKVVLSFLAVEGEEHPEGQVVQVPGVGGVLRSIVIYGPNASGKTNLVFAFGALCLCVLRGNDPGQPLPAYVHRLRPKLLPEPTRFEVEVLVERVRYSYGLVVRSDRVEAEWLVRVTDRGDESVFERDADGGIVIGPALRLEERRRDFYRFVAEGTRPEQPFLAELRLRNAVELRPLFDWFSKAHIHPADQLWSEDELDRLYAQFPALREYHAEVLGSAGTGIVGIEMVSSDPEQIQRLNRGLTEEEVAVEVGPTDGITTLFLHATGQEPVGLRYHDLSDGTRRLIWLASETASRAPVTRGSISWIDELDRSLHTQLTRFVLARMNASDGGNQFVLTTHDTNLLDAGVFGRDAIWFCEKDEAGATHLYSLVEFKKEQLDELKGHIEDGYLLGRFGALPFAASPVKLGWTKP